MGNFLKGFWFSAPSLNPEVKIDEKRNNKDKVNNMKSSRKLFEYF